jgi:hypothetical protein
MINLLTERVASLAALARSLPPGRRGRPTHPRTLYRWATRGLGGVRLEVIRVGGRTCSSYEALQRFVDALSATGTPEPTPTSVAPPSG